MKYSRQREALVNLLRNTRSHPSADWLYTELRKEYPKISLGTVYRNLALLVENGDIVKLNTDSDKEHFDGFTHKHYHFICKECKCIYDVDIPNTDMLDRTVERETGSVVENHSLIFYGKCLNCQKGEQPQSK